MSHSIIAPSSAGVWGKPGGCTMWPVVNHAHPEEEPTPESMEGEATHELASKLILGETPDDIASNGVVITEEMRQGAELYAEDVSEISREYGVFGGKFFGNEVKVRIPRVHPHSHGTPDQFLYSPAQRVLVVWDFKFGFSPVNAFENWQGINYVAGLLDLFDIDDQDVEVRIRIVQPRSFKKGGPIQEWAVMAYELRGYINQLEAAAEEVFSERAAFRSGEHCKHCPGRHSCETALRAGADMYEASMVGLPHMPTSEALGVQLRLVTRAVNQLEYIQEGIKAQVDMALRAGKSVPGWVNEDTFGNLAWEKTPEEVVALGVLHGVDLAKPLAVVTPTQAKAKGVDKDVITSNTVKRKTGTKVVPYDNTEARMVFGKKIR